MECNMHKKKKNYEGNFLDVYFARLKPWSMNNKTIGPTAYLLSKYTLYYMHIYDNTFSFSLHYGENKRTRMYFCVESSHLILWVCLK